MTEKKKRVGRPTKAELDSNTNGKRNKVGRPKGVAHALKEYQAMMVTSPKSRKVLQKILDAAVDDDHKNQAAAWIVYFLNQFDRYRRRVHKIGRAWCQRLEGQNDIRFFQYGQSLFHHFSCVFQTLFPSDSFPQIALLW